MYRPPGTNNIFYDECKQLLKECDTKLELILLGDFNIHWLDGTNKKKLQEVTSKLDLCQMFNVPTE